MLGPRARFAATVMLASILCACHSAFDAKSGPRPPDVSSGNGKPPKAHPENEWPDATQIELVKRKQSGFPVESWVTDVDWYEPLAIVRGGESKEIKLATKIATEFAAADALVDAHQSHAFLVWHRGALVHERYGANYSQNSRFDTASMHKSVVAILIGIAIDEGLIGSEDDRLDTYLTHLAGTSLGAVPLRAFLQMSSGIAAPQQSNDPASVYWQTYFGNDLKQAIGHWKNPLKPYEEFIYANANTQYLAWVIEKVSGMRYADFLAQKLWQPLGNAEARLWLDQPNGMPRASCCLQASARDWLRIGVLLLNSGTHGGRTIVSSDWVEKMTQPSTVNPNYGFQIWLGSPHQPKRTYYKELPVFVPAKDAFARDDIFYFDGSGGQRVYVVPSERLVIVRIGKASYTWDDSQLPNLIISLLETH
ncbi:MAG: serine hydrolase domain-containing protein [Gammaproteobacteria bacterium]